jgi:hypothetical protein
MSWRRWLFNLQIKILHGWSAQIPLEVIAIKSNYVLLILVHLIKRSVSQRRPTQTANALVLSLHPRVNQITLLGLGDVRLAALVCFPD